MSELEPTRTYSNPTATERIRAMLDERGGFRVDFDREGARRTCWKIDDEQDGYCYFDEDVFGATQLTVTRITPEQAIAATLGDADATAVRQGGAGTCEADETDLIPFVRADSDDFKVDYIHVMECTECGHTYEHVNGDYEFCPRCGRKRRDVEE